jgi:hypothetical protein
VILGLLIAHLYNYNVTPLQSGPHRVHAVKKSAFRHDLGTYRIYFLAELGQRLWDCLFPTSLGLEDKFHDFTRGTVSTPATSYVVGDRL